MSNDILEGRWKQIRGSAKEWWDKLTDSDQAIVTVIDLACASPLAGNNFNKRNQEKRT